MKVLGLMTAIVALALNGCVTIETHDPKPGQYSNYRDMMYATMSNFHFKDVPATLETKMVACTVDTMVGAMPADDMARLDAYARGEIKLSDSEKSALDRKMRDQLPKDQWDAAMKRTCPDTMDEVATWRAANG